MEIHDGEPLRAGSAAKNWRDAVRQHWMASVRLPHAERLPAELRVRGVDWKLSGRRRASAEPSSEELGLEREERGAEGRGADADDSRAEPALQPQPQPEPEPARPAAGGFSMPTAEGLKELWDAMDASGAGQLTLAQVEAGLETLWPGLCASHAASARWAFAAASSERVVTRRNFAKLLRAVLFFFERRAAFDEIGAAARHGGVLNAAEFAAAAQRAGVAPELRPGSPGAEPVAELNRAFAVIDADNSGYVRLTEFFTWAALRHARSRRRADDAARMLARAGDRSRSRVAEAPASRDRRRARRPMHHRDGHGEHQRAWEPQKGQAGADAVYVAHAAWGRRESGSGAAFSSSAPRFDASAQDDVPAPGAYHRDADGDRRRRVEARSFSRTGVRSPPQQLELAPSSPMRVKARSTRGAPARDAGRILRSRETFIDEHENHAQARQAGAHAEEDQVPTDARFTPPSDFNSPRGAAFGRKERFDSPASASESGPGPIYLGHKEWAGGARLSPPAWEEA